jgi:hypothetical protein
VRTVSAAIALVVVSATVVANAPSAKAAPWVPTPGLRWQYQLQGVLNTSVCSKPASGGPCVRPDVYDIDLYENNGTTPDAPGVAAIHAQGGHAVCYVDAGTWESFRPDANEYPAGVKGRPNGWPGERWLDIRQTGVLLPILTQRVAKCAAAHFDAVEFDNVDGYTNNTGFPLTSQEQLTFNEDLAGIAHGAGLSVGLKNDLGQLASLAGSFDFAINEQCAQYKECSAYSGWEAAHKAIVEVEYRGKPSKFCLSAELSGRDAMLKKKALKATPWTPCR